MSHDERQLRAMLREADGGPGHAQVPVLREVARHADAQGFETLAFDARMAIVDACELGGGDVETSFAAFAWCLAACDRDPGRYGGWANALLWKFKWVAESMVTCPDIPLPLMWQVLDDMGRRYGDSRGGQRPVYAARCLLATHVGDAATADGWHRRWVTAPLGGNSDCHVCDLAKQVDHLVGLGRDEAAVTLAEPTLRRGDRCAFQPQVMLGRLLLPYLRTGRHREAARAFRRSAGAVRGNREYLVTVARHIEFCAVTGNEARGLELLERYCGWYDGPADGEAMEFAASAALLLRRLAALGRAETGVRWRRGGDGSPTAPTASDSTVMELAAELGADARRVADRLDRRNGTTHQGGRITARLTAEPLGELSLSGSPRW